MYDDLFGFKYDSLSCNLHFVERDKKNLITTHKGISLVTIMTNSFKSEEMIAKWEMELLDIAQGKSSKKEFLKDIEVKIKEAILKYIGK